MTDTTMPNLNLLVSALKPGVWVEADFHDTLLSCEFTVRAPLHLDAKFGNLDVRPVCRST